MKRKEITAPGLGQDRPGPLLKSHVIDPPYNLMSIKIIILLSKIYR